MTESAKKTTLTGIIFSIVVTVGFIWAAFQWFTLWSKPRPMTVQDMQSNEQIAFQNLQTISDAQKKYKEKDWDGDGKKTYAKYFIHLWTSVSPSGDPIFVGLIPKKLGFALESARAVSGYYFIDLHERLLPDNKGMQPLDYEKEWTVLATPASNGQTGLLYFMADQSGRIFVNPAKFVSTQYPDNLISAGWVPIDSIQQLKDYQNKIIYPQNFPLK
jgi:hypothetical protein